MFSQNDVSKPTDHRGDIAQPYGPTSGESVYEKFRNISDEQQADIEANLHISPERLLNSQDLSNLTHFSFTAQESGPRISEVEPSGEVLDMMPQITDSLRRRADFPLNRD